MNLVKVLAQLHEELDVLNEAIATIEKLHHGGRRPGRPPRLVPPQAERATPLAGKQASKTERRHP